MDWFKLYNYSLRGYGQFSKHFFFNGFSLAPIHIFYLCTNGCNLNCSFCSVKDFRREGSSSSRDTHRAILRQLPKRSLVTFSGGEPFMMPYIEDILRDAASQRKISLITNGTLIKNGIAEKLISWAPSHLWQNGLFAIDISLHGIEDVHDRIVGQKGSFSRAAQTIERLMYYRKRHRRRFPLINVRCVMHRENDGTLRDVSEFAGKSAVDTVIFAFPAGCGAERAGWVSDGHPADGEISREKNVRFSPANISREEFMRYGRGEFDPRHYECLYPWTRMIVAYNGECAVCPGHYAGNLLEERFKTVWNGRIARKFRQRIKNNPVAETCFGCCGLFYKGKSRYRKDLSLRENHV